MKKPPGYSAMEVALITGLKQKTIYNRLSNGTIGIQFERVGRSVIFDATDTIRYALARQAKKMSKNTCIAEHQRIELLTKNLNRLSESDC